MSTFPVYASNFDWYPQDTDACRFIEPVLTKLGRFDFSLSVKDTTKNQGQLTSDFDDALEVQFLRAGVTNLHFITPPAIPQEHDFAFTYNGHSVAVEVEESNKEKILRDILKCHMYIDCGADFALVVLAKNYPHKHGVWNLYQEGVQRLSECRKYGFGTPNKLGKILLLGFDQFDAITDELLSPRTRDRMRRMAVKETLR